MKGDKIDMSSYPNQNTFLINKEDVKRESGKIRPYLTAYIDTIQNASQNLTGNSFKLYIYLLSNVNNYTSAFSPRDVADKYGCSVDSAREAFKTLVNKGYLTLIEGTKTKYIFKDVPVATPKDITTFVKLPVKKQFKIGNDIVEWTFEEFKKALPGETEENIRNLWEENREEHKQC